MSEARPRPGPAGLDFGTRLGLSFQRYLIAGARQLPAIPRSLGALVPHEIGPGSFLLALNAGEGVWLALEFGDRAPDVEIVAAGESGRRRWCFAAPPAAAIEMLAGAAGGSGGSRRFAVGQANFTRIDIVLGRDSGGGATVGLVDPVTFARRTGLPAPAPASAEDGYGGWRLP